MVGLMPKEVSRFLWHLKYDLALEAVGIVYPVSAVWCILGRWDVPLRPRLKIIIDTSNWRTQLQNIE
jgi:hypothetical protein